MLERGDEVIVRSPHWHCGVNVGDRLGVVVSVESYVLVHIYDYENNPVKCFRNEVEKVEDTTEEPDDEEGPEWYSNLFTP